MSDSHTRNTRQPRARSSRFTRRSRSRLERILAIQYSGLDPRRRLVRLARQLRPCQKSPSQKTATLTLAKTKSGTPGTFVLYRENDRFNLRRAHPRIRSGEVCRFRFDFMTAVAVGELARNPANETERPRALSVARAGMRLGTPLR
jgi:hypothetical protein